MPSDLHILIEIQKKNKEKKRTEIPHAYKIIVDSRVYTL